MNIDHKKLESTLSQRPVYASDGINEYIVCGQVVMPFELGIVVVHKLFIGAAISNGMLTCINNTCNVSREDIYYKTLECKQYMNTEDTYNVFLSILEEITYARLNQAL